MRSKLLSEAEGRRVFVLVFHSGDEVVGALTEFLKQQKIAAAQFSAIGAFSDATVRFFDWQTKKYQPIELREQMEVLVFGGDVAIKPDGDPKAHIHVVLGKADGTAHGGDLGQAHVRPTLELVLRELPAYLQRKHDEQTGLALIGVG